MKQTTNTRHILPLTALAALAFAANPAQAAITLLGTGFADTINGGPGDFTLTSGIYSYSYAAGATSDMLVISISSEKSGEAYSVSYGGQAMTIATQSSAGSGTNIWYLADPSASGSIAIDFSSVGSVNSIGLGIASLNGEGEEIAFDNGVSDDATASIDITTNFDDSFVMFAGDANDVGGNPQVNAPLTSIYGGVGNIGSSQAAAGYQNGVAAGANTYTWSPNSQARGISAAAFYAPVPEPSSAALIGLGGLALILRRRK